MSLAVSDPLSELEELRALTARLQAELRSRDLHIEKLKAQLAALRRMRFGRSSEKLDWQIEQLELAISEIEENEAQLQVDQAASLQSSTSSAVEKTASARGRASRCPLICRARRSFMILPAAARTAVARHSARSAQTSARCWNMSRLTSSVLSMCARS